MLIVVEGCVGAGKSTVAKGLAAYRNSGLILEAFETTYPNGVDEAGIIAIDYGVRGIPEKFFIDQQGVVRQKFVGPMQADALRAAIDGLLSVGPVPAKDATIDPY